MNVCERMRRVFTGYLSREGAELFGLLVADHFVVNPAVGHFEPVAQLGARFPAEDLLDEGIVAVAPIDAFRGAQVVVALQLNARDIFNDIHELIDGHAFSRSEVDGIMPRFTVRDHVDAFEAIGDVHEGAGLIAVAPNFNFVFSGEFRRNDFAADGGRCLFSTTVPSAEGSVNIVESSDAGRNVKIFAEMTAHTFAEEFFPAIAIFGHRRIRVFFAKEGFDFLFALFVRIVHTSARCVKEAFCPVFAGAEEQMRIDQDADHAQAFVEFDEAHAAHVAGEVNNDVHVFCGHERGIAQVQIGDDIFGFRVDLIPVSEGFDVHAADVFIAAAKKVFDEVPADEPSTSTYNCAFLLLHGAVVRSSGKGVAIMTEERSASRGSA